MAKKKAEAAGLPPGTAKRVGPRSGFVKAIFSVEPEQLTAIRAEAMRRAQEAGSIRPDVSAIVRDALTQWLSKARR
jgi:hypothetical protein